MTAKVVSVNPFKCRMWAYHDRIDAQVTEETCKGEIDSFLRCGQLISAYERGRSYARCLNTGCSDLRMTSRALQISPPCVSRALKRSKLPSIVVSAFGDPVNIRESWARGLSEAFDDSYRRDALLHKAQSICAAAPLRTSRCASSVACRPHGEWTYEASSQRGRERCCRHAVVSDQVACERNCAARTGAAGFAACAGKNSHRRNRDSAVSLRSGTRGPRTNRSGSRTGTRQQACINGRRDHRVSCTAPGSLRTTCSPGQALQSLPQRYAASTVTAVASLPRPRYSSASWVWRRGSVTLTVERSRRAGCTGRRETGKDPHE